MDFVTYSRIVVAIFVLMSVFHTTWENNIPTVWFALREDAGFEGDRAMFREIAYVLVGARARRSPPLLE